MTSLSTSPRDVFRVVMVCPSSGRVLAELRDGAPRIPRVSVPRYRRVVEHIRLAIEARWKIEIIIIETLAGCSRADRVVLVEAREHLRDLGTVFPVSFEDLDDAELSSDERPVIQRFISDGATGRGLFSRRGWIEEALDWVATEAAVDRSYLSHHVRQYNAGANYALVCFGQKPLAHWMKAAALSCLHELPITLMLAESFPEFLPPIIASRTDWNAWLMRDAGEPFSEFCSKETWQRVMVGLAALQQASSTRIDALLSGGCYDQRLIVLRAGIPAAVAYLEEAMGGQTTLKVSRLDVSRLRELGSVLEDACDSLDKLGIPATLIHNDINAGNILIRDGKVVFNDWAEACIGNPFITFEHLRTQAARNDNSGQLGSTLTEAYKQSWRSIVGDATIDIAFRLLPLVAPLSYLYGRGDWLTSPRRYDPAFQAHARSVARYIDRAALALEHHRIAVREPSGGDGTPTSVLPVSSAPASIGGLLVPTEWRTA